MSKRKGWLGDLGRHTCYFQKFTCATCVLVMMNVSSSSKHQRQLIFIHGISTPYVSMLSFLNTFDSIGRYCTVLGDICFNSYIEPSRTKDKKIHTTDDKGLNIKNYTVQL